MRKFLFAALFALSAAPAHAVCLKLDCSQDPKAWADMFGNSPAQRREQALARRPRAPQSSSATPNSTRKTSPTSGSNSVST
jgi:hypothetical protein